MLRLSKFVKGRDVDRFHLLFECLHKFCDAVSGNLKIFNDGADNKLTNTICNGLLLVFGQPDETVIRNGEDLRGKGIEVGIFTPRLDFPHDNGLGDRSCLSLGSHSSVLVIGVFVSKGINLLPSSQPSSQPPSPTSSCLPWASLPSFPFLFHPTWCFLACPCLPSWEQLPSFLQVWRQPQHPSMKLRPGE